MDVFDLTHAMYPGMPVYPGDEPPVFIPVNSIEESFFLQRKVSFTTHSGTHIDGPAHMIKGGRTLDQFSPGTFIGKALILNITRVTSRIITTGDLEQYDNDIAGIDFVILHTGWSRLWGTPGYYEGYPVLSSEAATWLSAFPLKGIGVDAFSIDIENSPDYGIHKIFLGRNITIIENLTGLDVLPAQSFLFLCFPLKIEHSEGSPVRAIAIFP